MVKFDKEKTNVLAKQNSYFTWYKKTICYNIILYHISSRVSRANSIFKIGYNLPRLCSHFNSYNL